MSLWKLAKAIAKDKSEPVEEVYQRLVNNRKKIRRMEVVTNDEGNSKGGKPIDS